MANQDFSKIKPFGPEPELQSDVVNMLQALQKKKGEKGIIKDSAGRVSSTLTPEEEVKYSKIFSIFKDVVFPGPEAGKIGGTTAKAQAAKTQMGASMTSSLGATGGDASTWMAALAGAILLMPWKDIFQTIWRSIKGAFAFGDLIKALGIDDLLRMGKSKILKTFNGMIDMLKNSKFMKMLDGGLSSLAEFGSKLKNSKWGKSALVMIDSIKNVFRGFEKVFSTIARPIQKVGSAMFKGAGAIVKMVGGAGAKFLQFGKFIPFIGSIFNFTTAVQAFGNGEYGRGILEIISGIANIIPGGQGISAILDGGLLLYDLFSENKTGEGTRDLFSGIGTKLKEMFSGVGDAILGVFGWMGDALTGVFDIYKNLVGGIFSKGFDLVKSALGSLPGVGGFITDLIDGAADFTADMFGTSSSASQAAQQTQEKTQTMINQSSSVQTELLALKKDEMKMFDFMCQKLDAIEKTNAEMLQVVGERTSGGRPTVMSTASKALDTAFYSGLDAI